MNEETIKKIDHWQVEEAAIKYAMKLVEKYGFDYVNDFIQIHDEEKKNTPFDMMVLEKTLDDNFIFENEWLRSELTFEFIFDSYSVNQWVMDTEDLIKRLEDKNYIVVYQKNKGGLNPYIFTFGYKAPDKFKDFIKQKYSEYTKEF